MCLPWLNQKDPVLPMPFQLEQLASWFPVRFKYAAAVLVAAFTFTCSLPVCGKGGFFPSVT